MEAKKEDCADCDVKDEVMARIRGEKVEFEKHRKFVNRRVILLLVIILLATYLVIALR